MGSATFMNQEWSSSGTSSADFDVFLNFRGRDTRRSLIDILRHFMVQSGVRFFYDDKSMRIGDRIDEQLMEGIARSQIYILMLSKRYAESKWCLRELTYMVKCQEAGRHGHKVILPIFYGVTVEDVKLKKGSAYAADLEKLDVTPKELEEWKTALRKVAAIKGLHFGDTTGYAEFSEFIVREVRSRLKIGHLSYHLVGIDKEVEEVEEKLNVESSVVRFLVIHGKKGTGKTTLAKAVFQRLSARFQGCSFIADIPEMKRRYGFIYLEHILLRDICGGDGKLDSTKESICDKKGVRGDNCKLGDHMKRNFRGKKVLIVLDGVDKGEQIENLAGSSTWFGPGSRIIITTSERHVVSMQLGEVSSHEKKKMKLGPAMQLFSRYAFWRDSPLKDFINLTSEVVNYCEGLPLMLEIMGSLLHRERNTEKWNGIIKNVCGSSKQIQNRLVKIYETLQANEKRNFLDIACFFVHEEKTNPTYMWNTLDREDDGLESLFMLSLVKIVDGNKLWMHDYVRNLGRDIVCRESYCRIECSRFWEHGDAFEALTSKQDKQNVEGICLYFGKYKPPSTLTHEDFRGKKELRFLRLYSNTMESISVKFLGDFGYCFPKLRWLSWHCAPEEFDATNFASATLVILDLARSRITANWDGWDQLKEQNNLRVIDLTSCRNLMGTPCLSQFTHLERLVLANCSQLKEIHPSVGELKFLRRLNIKGCDSLEMLPDEICSLKNLTEIVISKTIRGVFSLPNEIGVLESLAILEIDCVKIVKLPDSIGRLENLHRLSLLRCFGLYQLPESVGKLRSLVELDISGSEIERFPDSIEYLQALKVIKMEYSLLKELPCSIVRVMKLERVQAMHSTALSGVPDQIQGLLHLKILDLSHTSVAQFPKTVSQLSNLQKLQLPSCCSLSDLSELPKSLTHLEITYRTHCPMPKDSNRPEGLPKLEKLQFLELCILNGTDFQMGLSDFAPQLKRLHLSFQDLEDLQCCSPLPGNLSELILQKVKVHTASPAICELRKLSSLQLRDCKLSDGNKSGSSQPEERRPDAEAILFDNKLVSLVHFSASSSCFGITGGLRAPQGLRVLHLEKCEFSNSKLQLSGSKCLKQLTVSKCRGLTQFEGLGHMEQLEELRIQECEGLERLCGDISNSQRLKVIQISDSNQLNSIEGIKKVLSNVVCNISGTSLNSILKRSITTDYRDILEETLGSGEEQRRNRASRTRPATPLRPALRRSSRGTMQSRPAEQRHEQHGNREERRQLRSNRSRIGATGRAEQSSSKRSRVTGTATAR